MVLYGDKRLPIAYPVEVGLSGARLSVWVGLFLGLVATSPASADEYANQIEMTAVLLEAKPAGFDEACGRLLGKLVKGDGIAKCDRGPSVLAISFTGDVVHWAMIAYPSTSRDIEGLWQRAREVFGKPDVEKDKELTWRLKGGVTASAGYDDEYSTFALVRSVRK